MSKAEEKEPALAINQKGRFAFVIPVYNHAGSVAQVIQQALALNFPVFVVDDGSTDDTSEQNYRNSRNSNSCVISKIMGKGAAIMTVLPLPLLWPIGQLRLMPTVSIIRKTL